MNEVIHTIEFEADGIRIDVTQIARGYSVTMTDTDAGERLPMAHIFKAADLAIAKANDIAAKSNL